MTPEELEKFREKQRQQRLARLEKKKLNTPEKVDETINDITKDVAHINIE